MKVCGIIVFALLLLCGCGSVRPLETRCPRCGWLTETLGVDKYRDNAGYYYVDWYRCYSWSCGFTFSKTNRIDLASPKAKSLR